MGGRSYKSKYVNEQGQSQTSWESDVNTRSSMSDTFETPTGAINGVNQVFVFTSPPILVFRNGVMERRLGTVSGNTFTFNRAPDVDDDIEGVI